MKKRIGLGRMSRLAR